MHLCRIVVVLSNLSCQAEDGLANEPTCDAPLGKRHSEILPEFATRVESTCCQRVITHRNAATVDEQTRHVSYSFGRYCNSLLIFSNISSIFTTFVPQFSDPGQLTVRTPVSQNGKCPYSHPRFGVQSTRRPALYVTDIITLCNP